ncbi:MAG: type I glyceraldehyde-3-phosphate dehydrogenase [Candidatus Pacearchaeota archaeon]|nr:type I glyceraldehyde-3-phosphate dehydrogenase [Candidatus Pacearchaeota archaeon]
MKVAINGLGRIGRLVLKSGLDEGVNFVAINDLTDPKTLAYLIKYDSVYGRYDKEVEAGKDFIKIGNKKIMILSEKEPANLPWKKLGVDLVVESTGFFTDREGASKHLQAGAKRVVISAPAKEPDITIVPGVNDELLKSSHKIISMASCTTNGLAPVAKVLEDEFGIVKAFMTTAHAYTADQHLVDSPHKKMRRGRAAAANIVPTTSGATEAVAEVIPTLKGKMTGLALRVPVPSGSIVDFVAELEREVTKDEINKVLKKAASSGRLKGIMKYTEDEIVSSDIVGETHSSIVDGLSTQTIGNMVKVLAWYDNEFGYAHRLAGFLKKLG